METFQRIFKKSKMKIIYNNLIPFKGYSAMMFFGVIFARKKYKPLMPYIVNHEEIHKAQAKDCRNYIFYYCKYIYWYFRRGYYANPFEREAYSKQGSLNYLEQREKNAWKSYK